MKRFRYTDHGSWFKGNTHIHSTVSDGGLDFRELADLYASAGYHFLFRTDHWIASDCSASTDQAPLLWLDGVELDGEDAAGAFFHFVCLGKVAGLDSQDGLETALQVARAQDALIVLAHPHWTGNTFEDFQRWQPDGIEVYNHVCQWLNGKGSGLAHWNAALQRQPATLALAVDDAHLRPEHPGWNGGWIMVNAPELTASTLFAAIRQGNFYSSCGPQFHSIEIQADEVHVKTSPVQFIRLVGPRYLGDRQGSYDGHLVSEARFTLPEEWSYVYLEIEDERHRRAWTNTLFVEI